MKLLIQGSRLVGTATAAYLGPERAIDAPPGFDPLVDLDRYEYRDGALQPLGPPPLDPWQQARADLAAIRYRHETSGILINGMRVATDRESQALITGAWSYAQINPTALIDWKGADGVWVQIDAATIAGIAAAVAGHVQSCFSNERSLAELIAAAETAEELAGIDLESGWPA